MPVPSRFGCSARDTAYAAIDTSLAERALLSEYQSRANASVLRRVQVFVRIGRMQDGRMSDKRSDGDTIGLLGKTDLFKDLTAGELAACAAKFREQRLSKGQILFARGDVGNHLYL